MGGVDLGPVAGGGDGASSSLSTKGANFKEGVAFFAVADSFLAAGIEDLNDEEDAGIRAGTGAGAGAGAGAAFPTGPGSLYGTIFGVEATREPGRAAEPAVPAAPAVVLFAPGFLSVDPTSFLTSGTFSLIRDLRVPSSVHAFSPSSAASAAEPLGSTKICSGALDDDDDDDGIGLEEGSDDDEARGTEGTGAGVDRKAVPGGFLDAGAKAGRAVFGARGAGAGSVGAGAEPGAGVDIIRF